MQPKNCHISQKFKIFSQYTIFRDVAHSPTQHESYRLINFTKISKFHRSNLTSVTLFEFIRTTTQKPQRVELLELFFFFSCTAALRIPPPMRFVFVQTAQVRFIF